MWLGGRAHDHDHVDVDDDGADDARDLSFWCLSRTVFELSYHRGI